MLDFEPRETRNHQQSCIFLIAKIKAQNKEKARDTDR